MNLDIEREKYQEKMLGGYTMKDEEGELVC